MSARPPVRYRRVGPQPLQSEADFRSYQALLDSTRTRRNQAGGCCDWSCDLCSSALEAFQAHEKSRTVVE